jgi:hypothetical protein
MLVCNLYPFKFTIIIYSTCTESYSSLSPISGAETNKKEFDPPRTPPPNRQDVKTVARMPSVSAPHYLRVDVLNHTVYVNFTGKLKSEIIIESSDRVRLTIDAEGEGGPTYSASLKEILTEAISGDSPMKGRT